MENKRKIKVYKSERDSRSKKMKPIFESLENDPNVNIEILTLEDDMNSMWFMLEEFEGYPTIRFYNDGKFYKELVGMATKEEILRIYEVK
jgi:hypothetical protein